MFRSVSARKPSRWADLGIRTASALVMVPTALLCLWAGGIAWFLLILLCFGGLLGELIRLARNLGNRPGRGRFLAIGTLYALIAALSLAWLRGRPDFGWADVLFLFLVVWATDIGAYLVGRWLGGRKLAPRISPGKTWSGAAGGLAFGIIIGIAIAISAAHSLIASEIGGAVPAAAIISIVAQAGDLMESAVKRWLRVKDSGRTIPGHGGLFDRLDGILAAAPFAAMIAFAAQGGMPLWR